ncbi:MAG: hypothetical protein LBM98_07965 [Oscillospiraceae bacterium]|jgi:hypothetical protein|nr:hypothetical protein [Oscillospiraceae bacterium]
MTDSINIPVELETDGLTSLLRQVPLGDIVALLRKCGDDDFDYTAERDNILGDITMEEAIAEVTAVRSEPAAYRL